MYFWNNISYGTILLLFDSVHEFIGISLPTVCSEAFAIAKTNFVYAETRSVSTCFYISCKLLRNTGFKMEHLMVASK